MAMLGSLSKAIGSSKGSRYEKVTTSDDPPTCAFAIDEDDDIEKLSQLHRDLVVQAQNEIQEAEVSVSQLLSERQQHEHRVRAILSEPSASVGHGRQCCCCRRTACVIL